MSSSRLLLAQRSMCIRAFPQGGAAVVAGDNAMRHFCSLKQEGMSLRENHWILAPRTFHQKLAKKTPALLTYNNNNHLSASCRRFSSAAAAVADDDNNKTTIPFNLADIGEGIKEVELLQWFVQEGDTVKQFDRICEVQSDKATVEITSRYDGVVESLAGGSVGDMVQVGDPLMYIQVDSAEAGSQSGGGGGGSSQSQPGKHDGSQGESSSSSSQKKAVLCNQDSSDNQLHIPHVASQFHLDSDNDRVPFSATAATGGSGKFLATPAVRKLGMEYNIDLSTLVGTGPNGRVLKADVITFLKESGRIKQEPQALAQAPSSDAAGKATTANEKGTAASQTQPQPKAYLQEDEVVTLKGYNRFMIQTMTASQEIPHMGYQDDFNLTKLSDYRKDLSPKVSMLAFFIKATSLALKEYPIINASWKDIEKGEVNVWANHNIGVAMDTPRGLVVPVIHNCQGKSLVQIQEDLNELKDVAAAGKLTEQHLTGATFSISNIGSLGGGTYMSPLIVPPQAAIGALGTMQNVPRFDSQGNVVAAKIMSISWAGDHRMFDGATLARFSNLCKDYLEDPVRMLVAMS